MLKRQSPNSRRRARQAYGTNLSPELCGVPAYCRREDCSFSLFLAHDDCDLANQLVRNNRALTVGYVLPDESSSFAAIFTNCANESACIFRITWPRWIFTVISLVPRSEAICLLSLPETTSPITSRSRAV